MKKIIRDLKLYGKATWKQYEIWETTKDGEYTGNYRIARLGNREGYTEANSLTAAISEAQRRKSKDQLDSEQGRFYDPEVNGQIWDD